MAVGPNGLTGMFQFSAGVGPVNGSTIPSDQYGTNGNGAYTTTVSDTSSASVQTGNTLLGEPVAVWLGFIILLILLKVLAQAPGIKVLGENVNPAYIRIGGYNVAVVTISAAIGFIAIKVLANSVPKLGLQSFANAL